MTTALTATASADPSADTPRVLALKRSVGYDAALAQERTDEHVAMDWPVFPAPDSLQAWTLERDITQISEGEQMLRMRFTQGDARITIRISAFAAQERARVADKLIQRADAVTSAHISDTRGPSELGTLSLVPAATTTRVVYWIFRNIYSEVTVSQAPLDAIDIALWIQGQFKHHVRPV